MVIESSRRGRAAACNAAVGAASGEILVVLDDDMEPASALVGRHRAAHAAERRRCVLGPVPVSDDDRSPVARYIAGRFARHMVRLAEPDHRFIARDFYSGNMSLRRDVFLEVGGFDESFAIYGNEDVDLFLKLRAAGVEIGFDATAAAVQRYTKSFGELVADTVAKGRTAVHLARRRPEAIPELRLAHLETEFDRWRVLRGALLGVSLRSGRAARALGALARTLERLGAWRLPLYHVLVLDYFYWYGVSLALAEAPVDGPLAELEADLRRGTLRLLLHR
jgi:GT2 family glycosyltransferase